MITDEHRICDMSSSGEIRLGRALPESKHDIAKGAGEEISSTTPNGTKEDASQDGTCCALHRKSHREEDLSFRAWFPGEEDTDRTTLNPSIPIHPTHQFPCSPGGKKGSDESTIVRDGSAEGYRSICSQPISLKRFNCRAPIYRHGGPLREKRSLERWTL